MVEFLNIKFFIVLKHLMYNTLRQKFIPSYFIVGQVVTIYFESGVELLIVRVFITFNSVALLDEIITVGLF